MSFNINNVSKKAVIYFSLFGFILSLISGLTSGTTFGTVIFRSIVSGLVVGVVIAICNVAIIVYLPELLDQDVEPEQEDGSEGTVDIVMPEEGYTVQQSAGSEDSTEVLEPVNEINEETPAGTEFKEVDMSNLKNLSSQGVVDADFVSASEQSDNDELPDSGEMTFTPAASDDGESIAGEHSVEEMAKAVKTVLKKD